MMYHTCVTISSADTFIMLFFKSHTLSALRSVSVQDVQYESRVVTDEVEGSRKLTNELYEN